VHFVAHDIRVVEVAVAHFHPRPDRLRGTVRDQASMKFPMRRRGSRRSAATAGSRRCRSR
jgi:hypothetical protein